MINRIGYTQEGLIFLVIDGEHEGKPMQSITQMTPANALKVMDGIKQAVEKVYERNGVNPN